MKEQFIMHLIPPDKREPSEGWTIIRNPSDPSDLRIYATYLESPWTFSSRITKVKRYTNHATVKTKSGSSYKLWYDLETVDKDLNKLFNGKIVAFSEVLV